VDNNRLQKDRPESDRLADDARALMAALLPNKPKDQSIADVARIAVEAARALGKALRS
jgi:hypothetical protein